jgi:hypothetical protein
VFLLSDDRNRVSQKLRLMCTSYYSKRLRGHFRRWGGSNCCSFVIVAVLDCCSFLIAKPERLFPFGSIQQFQGLGIVVTHVTDSRNNLKTRIMTGVKNLTQKLQSYRLGSSTAEVIRPWCLKHSHRRRTKTRA